MEKKTEKEDFDEYYKKAVEAGRIASKALIEGKRIILEEYKEEKKILNAIKKIESYILEEYKEKNAKLAFPVQISIDEIAAHDTAKYNDERILKGMIKLDLGVHIEGVIADNALTIDLTEEKEKKIENKKIIEAGKKALEEAIKKIKVEGKINEVSKTIEETIKKYSLKPISNLSGHGLGKYKIHTSPSIPNINLENNKDTFKEKMHFAIEPFTTNGYGKIKNYGEPEVFRIKQYKNVRNIISKNVLKIIYQEYNLLPFSLRQIAEKVGIKKAEYALNDLILQGIIEYYTPLIEVQKGIVSQFERTIIIKDEKIKITTNWELE